MYLNNAIIYAAVVFFPLQYFAIRFFTSAYDITSLLLIINVLLVSISSFYVSKKTIIILSIFVITECLVVLIFNIGPYYRFLSGILWLSALLLIITNGEKNHKYSQKIVFQIILYTLAISSIYMCIEYFFVIEPNTSKRPKAGFSEPSYAALALLAGAAALISMTLISRFSKKYLIINCIILILLLAASFFAKSMHFVTFAIALVIIIVLWLSYKISIIKLTVFFLIVFFIFCAGFILLSYPHYYDRVNIFVNPASMTNPSLLSWLRGLDQAIVVLKNSPLFGYGIGSTGYFDFESAYGDRLAYYRIYDLTLRDAFSLLWRLIIEIGILPIFIFSIYLLSRIREFRLFLINNHDDKNFKYIVFNFTFALALILGCLIKEPNYARSTMFLGIFLISTVSLKINDK